MQEEKKDFTIEENVKSNQETEMLSVSIDNISVTQSTENCNEDDDYITYDKVVPKEIDWLWKPYLVKGNINIIVGNGEVGKSFYIAWLASAKSKGDKIPFSDLHFNVGNSLIQDAEGDPETVNIHRLIANGADLSKIGYINEDNKAFTVKQLERLENKIIKWKPEMIVLDPIQAYLGNINMNSANEVRDCLKPLKELAQKYNVAIILIMHLNKNTDASKATYRTMGSIDFVSAARSVLMITEDPNNHSQRLLIPIKNNLMKNSEKRTLCYKINDNGKLEWLEDKGFIDHDKILNQNETFDVKDSVAKGFILGVLSKGDISANDLKELAMSKGNLSERAFNTVKAELRKNGLVDYYQKDNQFYWTLKKQTKEEN